MSVKKVYQVRGVSTDAEGLRITFDVGPRKIVNHTIRMNWYRAAELIRQMKKAAKQARIAAQAVEDAHE